MLGLGPWYGSGVGLLVLLPEVGAYLSRGLVERPGLVFWGLRVKWL